MYKKEYSLHKGSISGNISILLGLFHIHTSV